MASKSSHNIISQKTLAKVEARTAVQLIAGKLAVTICSQKKVNSRATLA
jgi:hypothetical protein